MNSKTQADLLTEIVTDYRPYDTHEAFGEGFVAYEFAQYRNPYDGRTDGKGVVAAQAWDRGLEAGSRYARATQALELAAGRPITSVHLAADGSLSAVGLGTDADGMARFALNFAL